MTREEYEQKKHECWKQFCKDNDLEDNVHVLAPTAFDYAFDRAYALGKLQANCRQVNNAKTPQNLADCDISFDNILKDKLSDNLRLGIAARILAAYFAKPNIYMDPERKKIVTDD